MGTEIGIDRLQLFATVQATTPPRRVGWDNR